VEDAVRAVDGVRSVHVELVWDPPWDQDRISDEAKLSLGLF
jgi:metal-sulfur cluster biosynthetic enzyme